MSFTRFLAAALGHDPDAPREPLPKLEPVQLPDTPEPTTLLVVAGAHHPRDRGMAHGSNHYTVTRALDVGRLHRRPGDALCKPASKFWGLYSSPEREANCKLCVAIAARFGLTKETPRD